MTLRSPFAEALQAALRHAKEDHSNPGWLLEQRWRGYLRNAQELADARAAGNFPDWRDADYETPTLGWALLAFIGDEPPADLLDELDRRARALEANDPTADRRGFHSEASVRSYLETYATVRYLVEQFQPKKRLS